MRIVDGLVVDAAGEGKDAKEWLSPVFEGGEVVAWGAWRGLGLPGCSELGVLGLLGKKMGPGCLGGLERG